MGIDKETNIKYLNIVMEDTPKYLKQLKEQAEKDDQNDCLDKGENRKLCLTTENYEQEVSEYYLEIEDGKPSIYWSGELKSSNGEVWVSFELPLSDTVLLDILENSMKRLGKLKTAMETLK